MKLTEPQAYLLQKIADGDALCDCLAANLSAPSRARWERVLRTLREKKLVRPNDLELTSDGKATLHGWWRAYGDGTPVNGARLAAPDAKPPRNAAMPVAMLVPSAIVGSRNDRRHPHPSGSDVCTSFNDVTEHVRRWPRCFRR